MKKKEFKNLSLNKKIISNLKSNTIAGGNTETNSCRPLACFVRDCETNENGCEVPIDGEENETLFTCISACFSIPTL